MRQGGRPSALLAHSAAASAALALTAGVARAHRLRTTEVAVPIPLWLLSAGAGATVALTAGWLAIGTGGDVRAEPRALASVPAGPARAARWLSRAVALAAFAAVLGHGLLGPRAPAENLATVVAWPLAVKGVALVAVVAGSPWRALSPWETLYESLVAVEGREIAVLGGYPDRLGHWPAVAGFVLGIGILETLTVATLSPTLTVAAWATYTTAMLVGGVAFGREWFARADALAVLFALLGRASVLTATRRGDGGLAVSVRPPWAGVTAAVADRSLVVFVVAAVYTVSFDGFANTRTYRTLLDTARDALGVGAAGVGLYLAGLAAFVAGFSLAATLAARAGERSETDRPRTALAFAGSVVPIAAAYEVAHNYPYVAANLGQAVTIAGGLGGWASGPSVAPLAGLPVLAFWLSQVSLVVVGHLIAVVAAHRVATRRYGTPAAARRGHAPFVAVMVGYTVLSLWIVSQPIAA